MEDTWIIVNPAAGGGRARSRWRRTEEELRRAGLRYKVAITAGPGDATGIAQDLVRRAATRVGVFGGDGTVHEVIQALAGTGVAIAFLGGGSSCDFGKELPRRTVAERLTSEDFILRDVLRVECEGMDGGRAECLVANGSHIGVVAEAAQRMNVCGWRGRMVDVAAVVSAVSAYRAWTVPEFAVCYEDGEVRARLLNLTVTKSNWVCGRMSFGLPRDDSDGRFHVVAARSAALGGLLMALYRGEARRHPAVSVRRERVVEVREPVGAMVEADGELIGRVPVRYSVWAKALRVAV
ncbi:MAG: hypothetical protein HY820_36475 [Acidobacteria bacterium]|nr:hypothetical protein [Acidobacteriota bacterium]